MVLKVCMCVHRPGVRALYTYRNANTDTEESQL